MNKPKWEEEWEAFLPTVYGHGDGIIGDVRPFIRSTIKQAQEEAYKEGCHYCYRDSVQKHGYYRLGKKDGALEILSKVVLEKKDFKPETGFIGLTDREAGYNKATEDLDTLKEKLKESL